MVKSTQIRRVKNLSVDEFNNHFYSCGEPVVIENCLFDWPALNWSLSSVKEKAGHRQVFVRRNTDEVDYKVGKKYNIESMTFREYVENIEYANSKSKASYMAVQNIKTALPELMEDLRIPNYVPKIHGGPFLWIARKGHYEFCHFDPDDNFLIILSGRKHVKLYGADIVNMYPNQLGSKGKTIQSQIDCDLPVLEKFPKYAAATCLECTLEAGEMLFFPAFWWHQVTSLENTISMNIFFGNAGSNEFLAKVMKEPQWPCFKYWLLNIIEQNREKEQFQRVLQYLPDALRCFLLKQWHETPNADQLAVLVKTVLDYCGLEHLPQKPDEEPRNFPQLKIRGLLWRS